MLTIPGLPEASNWWGYTDSRYQGPKGGFPGRNVISHQGRIAFGSELLFLVAYGFRAPPEGVEAAVGFITEGGIPRMKACRKARFGRPRTRAQFIR